MTVKVIRADLASEVEIRDSHIVSYLRVTIRRLPAIFRQDFDSGRLKSIPEEARFAVVYVLGGADVGTHELSANIVAPTGAYAESPTRHTIEWPPAAKEIESMLWLGTIMYTGPGRYEVRFAYDGEPLAVLPFTVEWDDVARRGSRAENQPQ